MYNLPQWPQNNSCNHPSAENYCLPYMLAVTLWFTVCNAYSANTLNMNASLGSETNITAILQIFSDLLVVRIQEHFPNYQCGNGTTSPSHLVDFVSVQITKQLILPLEANVHKNRFGYYCHINCRLIETPPNAKCYYVPVCYVYHTCIHISYEFFKLTKVHRQIRIYLIHTLAYTFTIIKYATFVLSFIRCCFYCVKWKLLQLQPNISFT